MISALISAIVAIVILAVVWWAVQQLLSLLPLPEPFARIINVLMMVLLVFIVLWVTLTLLGGVSPAYVPHWVR